MITVEEARARLLAAFEPVGAENVSIADADGRVLAQDVVARRTQPPSDLSAMDGYAVRAADLAPLPVTLSIIGSIAAGSGLEQSLGPGECARIFTGAPLPGGADTVVIQEDCEANGTSVTVKAGGPAGRHVRVRGLDFVNGETVLAGGRRLDPRAIGLAAATNHPWLSVRRRPRIAILGTGDEIVRPGEPIGPNQIVSANSLALAALVRRNGAAALDLGTAPDEPQALERMADSARGADLLVTTGGASVGAHDHVRDVLGQRGDAIDFWKIAMRPGKPLMFGSFHGTPFLGLPGNPVSALVCATLFLEPVIDRLLGLPAIRPQFSVGVLGRDLPANGPREDYVRSRLEQQDGNLTVLPFSTQDSSMMSTFAQSDILAIRPAHAAPATAGETISYLTL